MSDERERVDVSETADGADRVDDADFEGHRLDIGRMDDGQVDVGRMDDGKVDVA